MYVPSFINIDQVVFELLITQKLQIIHLVAQYFIF